VAYDVVYDAMETFVEKLSEASIGEKEASESFTELGLSAQDLNNKLPFEALKIVADRFNQVESASAKVRIGMKFFESSGIGLLNTLQLGSKGLEDYKKRALEAGVALTKFDVKHVTLAIKAIHDATVSLKGLGRAMTVQIAPFITLIARRLTASGRSAEYWRDTVVSSIQGVAMGIAKLSDSFNFLSRMWKSIELGFASVMLGLSKLLESFLKGFDKLPIVGEKIATFTANVKEFSLGAKLEVKALSAAIADLGNQKPSSEGVREFFEELKAIRAEAYKPAVETQNFVDLIPLDDEKNAAEKERKKKHLDEIAQLHRNQQDGRLGYEGLVNELLKKNRAGYQKDIYDMDVKSFARLRNVEVKENKKLAAFNKMVWWQKVAHVSNALLQMTNSVASSNKTMFRINQIASAATAIVNTAQGVTRALAEYPPPLSFAMAAAQFAAGMAQVSAIKNASFGGGGHVPSTPSGGAPSAFLPERESSSAVGLDTASFSDELIGAESEEPKKEVNIYISGNPTGDQVRDLISEINEQVGNGTSLVASEIA